MSDFHLESYALEGRIRVSTIELFDADPPVFETIVFYEDGTPLDRATCRWSSLPEAQQGHERLARQWERVDLGACLECAGEAPSLGLVVDHQGFCVSVSSHSAVCASCTTTYPCENHPYWCRDCTREVFCDRHYDEDA